MPIVYSPSGEHLTARDMARWANKVHRQAGGKGAPFSTLDYIQSEISSKNSRLRGHMCDCGVDSLGYSNGEFKLLPLNDEAVVEGGKAYMVCQRCGATSHL